MKFLIAGYGSIGRRHFRNLRSLGEDDILFYRTHKGTLEDEELSGYPVETDLEDALAHDPDAVIVSNPTSLHLDVALPSARAGCHLLLEKPVSDNLDRLQEFRDVVDQAGVKVLVGFQFRFHPGLIGIKQLLADEQIGDILSVRAHWGEYLPSWHPWEDYRQGYSAREDLGGGVVLTLSHPFDYLHWLCGEIDAVWAFLSSRSDLNIDVEDTAEIGLRFTTGALGSVHLDFIQRPTSHMLEMIGSAGTIRWDYGHGHVAYYDLVSQSWNKRSIPVDFVRNDMFLEEMKHFLGLISGDVPSRCSLADGIYVQRMIESVKLSGASGKVVPIDQVEIGY